jgi:hypothetical protein
VPDYVIRVRRSTSWIVVLIVLVVIGAIFVANRAAPVASNGSSVAISLKVVPTIRSVTVSPGTASFSNCTGGSTGADTASTSTELGYPNGQCWEGTPGAAGSFPITITYNGPPGLVYVNGSSAIPSAGGVQWGLCNSTAACTGPDGLPGVNQYMVKTFGRGSDHSTELTGTQTCDQQFDPGGGCGSAASGASQTEGIQLIGPESSGNTSSSWTVTITWAAAPPGS